MTNCCSLDNVPDWIELGRKERFGRLKKPLIVLVGNKVDDTSRRQVNNGQFSFFLFVLVSCFVFVFVFAFAFAFRFCFCFCFFVCLGEGHIE